MIPVDMRLVGLREASTGGPDWWMAHRFAKRIYFGISLHVSRHKILVQSTYSSIGNIFKLSEWQGKSEIQYLNQTAARGMIDLHCLLRASRSRGWITTPGPGSYIPHLVTCSCRESWRYRVPCLIIALYQLPQYSVCVAAAMMHIL